MEDPYYVRFTLTWMTGIGTQIERAVAKARLSHLGPFAWPFTVFTYEGPGGIEYLIGFRRAETQPAIGEAERAIFDHIISGTALPPAPALSVSARAGQGAKDGTGPDYERLYRKLQEVHEAALALFERSLGDFRSGLSPRYESIAEDIRALAALAQGRLVDLAAEPLGAAALAEMEAGAHRALCRANVVRAACWLHRDPESEHARRALDRAVREFLAAGGVEPVG